MGFVSQDIISKKLLMLYSIENTKNKFNELKHEIYIGEEDNFSRITRGLNFELNLEKRIIITLKNIEYLLGNGLLQTSILQELKKEIEVYLLKCKYWQKRLKKIYEDSKNKYENNELNVNDFLYNVKNTYMSIISMYENYMYSENKLTEKIVEIWRHELTNYKTYIKGNDYNYLAYATALKAEDVINVVLNKNALIYTSYITNRHTKVYHDRGYGLIFEPHTENILFMCSSDSQSGFNPISLNGYTFSIDKNYFFSGGEIIEAYQLSHNMGRTYTPKQLLDEGYNEIDLVNNEYTIPKAVFVFDDADDFCKNEAMDLVRLLNLDLLELKR